MFILSLILFAAVLVVLAIAASRGLSRLSDILEIQEPDDLDLGSPRSLANAGN